MASGEKQLIHYKRIALFQAKLAMCQSFAAAADLAARFLRMELCARKGCFYILGDSQISQRKQGFGWGSLEAPEFSWEWKLKAQPAADESPTLHPLESCGQEFGFLYLFLNSKQDQEQIHLMGLFLPAVSHALKIILRFEAAMRTEVDRVQSQELARLRATNLKLQDAVAAKSLFFSQMSHEIRTPLNSIIGISDLIRGQLEDGENVIKEVRRDRIETIIHAGEDLLSLINDILEIAKMDANELQLDFYHFDLVKMIKDTVYMFRFKSSSKDLKISYEIAPSIQAIRIGDGARLKQVLVNLMGNSVKFTPSGEVSLQVSLDTNEKLRFQVFDTGLGIPDSKKKTIFSDFCQGGQSVQGRFGGTGLGLSICRNIVTLMGGSIVVSDNPAGSGSLFEFQVVFPPGKEEKVQAPIQLQEIKPTDLPSIALSILVVDDSPENRFLMKAIFASTHYEVLFAENGQEAVDSFSVNKIDMIFMDIQMPEMDGIEATQIIRRMEQKQEKRIPIVALTASASECFLAKLLELGFSSKMTKPVKRREIFLEIFKYFYTADQPKQAG